MNLQTLGALMGAVDQVLEGVEARREVWIVGARLERLQVVRVAAPPDLHEQRIQIGVARPGDELVHLLGGLEAVVERVDPDRAQLGRVERRGDRAPGQALGRAWTSPAAAARRSG